MVGCKVPLFQSVHFKVMTIPVTKVTDFVSRSTLTNILNMFQEKLLSWWPWWGVYWWKKKKYHHLFKIWIPDFFLYTLQWSIFEADGKVVSNMADLKQVFSILPKSLLPSNWELLLHHKKTLNFRQKWICVLRKPFSFSVCLN